MIFPCSFPKRLSLTFFKSLKSIFYLIDRNKCFDYLFLSIVLISSKIFDDYLVKLFTKKKKSHSPAKFATQITRFPNPVSGRYTEMHDYTYTAEEERRLAVEIEDRKRSLSFAMDTNPQMLTVNVSPLKDLTAPKPLAHLNVSDTLQLTQSFENHIPQLEKIFPENYLANIFGENMIIVTLIKDRSLLITCISLQIFFTSRKSFKKELN